MRRTKTEFGSNEPALYTRLKVLRVERGMSRQQLADVLEVNYQTVGYIERGEYNPSLELAFRISEFFGLPIEAIFSRKPFRPLSEAVYGTTTDGEGAMTSGVVKQRGAAR